MVSYWTQLVLVLLFGPLAMTLDGLGISGPPWFRLTLEAASELQPLIRDSNAFFCTSIVISAIIGFLSWTPSIIGLSFIYHVLRFELSMVSISAFPMAWSNYNVGYTGKQLAFSVFVLVIFIIHIVLCLAPNPLASTFEMYTTIQQNCQLHHGFVYSISGSITAWLLDYISTIIAWGSALVLLMTVLCGWPPFRRVVRNRLFDWCKTIWLGACPVWLQKNGSKIYLVVLSALLMLGSGSAGAVLQWLRLTEHKLSGPLYQDNKWGFGQVMAVLIWLPVLMKAVEMIWSTPRST